MKPDIGRLKTRREFLRVAAARRKRAVPGLILQAARRGVSRAAGMPAPPSHERGGDQSGAERDAIRVGFTASRKVGKAVARNRARRRLRAAAAEVIPDLGRPGYDYVLVARKETLKRPYRDLVRDLRRALRDLGDQETSGRGVRRPFGKAKRPADRTASGDRT